jgi:hypothetical protein
MGCCESRASAELEKNEPLQQGSARTPAAQSSAIALNSLEIGLESRGASTGSISYELEVLRATVHICSYFHEQFSARLAAIDTKLQRSRDPTLSREVAESRRVEQYLSAYIQNMEPRLARAERIGIG